MSQQSMDNDRKHYELYFGCIFLNFKDTRTQLAGESFRDKIEALLLKESIVSAVYREPILFDEDELGEISKFIVGDYLSDRISPSETLNVFALNMPVVFNLSYDADLMDPDFHKDDVVKIPMKATLVYDGFVYCLSIAEPKTTISNGLHYRGQAAGIHRWLQNILSKDDIWDVILLESEPSYPQLKLFLQPRIENSKDAAYLLPMKYEPSRKYSHDIFYCYDTLESNTLNDALQYLWIFGASVTYTNYYCCIILAKIIQAKQSKAMEGISHIAVDSLEFSRISFWNMLKRFKKCRQMEKSLAELYVLMPTLERLNNEYDQTVHKMHPRFSDLQNFEAFVKELVSRLQNPKADIFTNNIQDMLTHNTSEIREQINYQLIIITAILAFVAVVLSALLPAILR